MAGAGGAWSPSAPMASGAARLGRLADFLFGFLARACPGLIAATASAMAAIVAISSYALAESASAITECRDASVCLRTSSALSMNDMAVGYSSRVGTIKDGK